MALALVRAMMGRWKNDPDLEFGKARRLTIHARHRRRIRVSNDGEVAKLAPPLRYTIRPQALVIIEPTPTDPAQTLRGKPLPPPRTLLEGTRHDTGAGMGPAP